MRYLAIEVVGKRNELRMATANATHCGPLPGRNTPGADLDRAATEAVVKKFAIELSYFPDQSRSFLPARDVGELETAFYAVVQDHCDALVVFPDSAMYELQVFASQPFGRP